MKKLVVLLSLVATVSAFSQGQVNFVTKNSTAGAVVNAIITYDGNGPLALGTKPTLSGGTYITDGAYTWGGPNARAALYAGPAGTAEGQLAIITPSIPFRIGAAGGYVDPNTSGGVATREVPGVAAGGQATFQIRAWDTGLAPADNTMSFEQAKTIITANGKGYYGVGNVFTIATGGGSVAPTYLTPAAAFTMNWVPEPSIIGLGILGAIAGMVVFRRRQ